MSMQVGGASGSWGAGATTGASMRMSPQQKYSKIFDQIDTSSSGSISKSQFAQAFSSLKMPPSFKSKGADAIFAQLDPSGSGSVSKKDFVAGMVEQMKAMRAARAQSATQSADGGFDSLLQSLGAATASASKSAAAAATAATGSTLDMLV